MEGAFKEHWKGVVDLGKDIPGENFDSGMT
jgi:hypothetical protein